MHPPVEFMILNKVELQETQVLAHMQLEQEYGHAKQLAF